MTNVSRDFVERVRPLTYGFNDLKRICMFAVCFGFVWALCSPFDVGAVPQADSQKAMPPIHTGMPLEKAVLKSGQKRFERLLQSFDPAQYFDIWEAGNQMKAELGAESLVIEAQRERPMLYTNLQAPEGEIRLSIRLRTSTASDCVVRWLTATSPRRSDDKAARIRLINDGQWHDYEVQLPVRGAMTSIAIEFSETSGRWEVGHFSLWVNERYPLVVTEAHSVGETIEYTVVNKGEHGVTFQHAEQTHTLSVGENVRLTVQPEARDNFYVFRLLLQPEGYPEFEFSAFRYRLDPESRWYVLPLGRYRFYVAESGNMAYIQSPNSQSPLAILGPLSHSASNMPHFATETQMPLLQQAELNDTDKIVAALQAAQAEGNTLTFHSDEGRLSLQTVGDEIRIEIESPQAFEGPVVRAFGAMQGALLSGCEYLGPHDSSSSSISVNERYSDRFAPPTTWLTLPLMLFSVTNIEQHDDRDVPVDSVIAMTWDDMNIQPTFSIVNQVDVTDDLRMSLQGEHKICATLRVNEGRLVDGIAWYLNHRPLPEVPPALRSTDEQNALTLQAFDGPLTKPGAIGWGFCAEPDWERRPYDSHASTVWRLSGQIPFDPEQYVVGGSAIPNEMIYFLTRRVLDLVDMKGKLANLVAQEMRADGSFLFATRFPDVESTVPAAGYCARQTLELMAYARLTGDRRFFQHAEKGLAFLEGFQIPRGGYFKEAPLHTPDLLSAAHLVILHVWAYEFSRDIKYLEKARYWAMMGVPFVYLRDGRPYMPYATVPMYGASERETPIWFGTSQPWCGCVYAYGITQLGKYDKSVDWPKIARGILHHAESLQYTDGHYIGCIPDGFSLETQESISWKVNPAVLASLRWLLDTLYHSFVVVSDSNIHVASPFPVKLTRDGILIEGAPEGLEYQLMINGAQIIDIRSGEGPDFVPVK